MLPEFSKFKEIELTDKHDVEAYFSLAVRKACEYSFPNLYIWRDFDRPKLAVLQGNLCILIEPLDESPFFLEPVGNGNAVNKLNILMEHTGRISRASSEFAAVLTMDKFKISRIRDHDDYIYSVRELAELKGRGFDGKRNHIKTMQRMHPNYEFVEFGPEYIADAMQIFETWCASKRSNGGAELPSLAYECQLNALNRAFEDYYELGLFGSGIVLDNKLAGFLIVSVLTKDTACVHFQYHLPDVPGISQTLLWETCRKTFSAFEHVNLEQDLGIAGLRRHKESYHPIKMEEKFDIELK